MKRFLKNNKGFTLVELIVVMAVLAIISAIAVPRFLGVQEKAKEDADYATGAMVAKAAELYEAKENNVGDTITAKDLIDKNYINSITFKSDEFKDASLEKILITFGTGSVSVAFDVDTGDDLPLYPRP